jgi:hypothetical protein
MTDVGRVHIPCDRPVGVDDEGLIQKVPGCRCPRGASKAVITPRLSNAVVAVLTESKKNPVFRRVYGMLASLAAVPALARRRW